MIKEEVRACKNVYFNDTEIIHVVSYTNEDDDLSSDLDTRSRFAFVVIRVLEVKELIKDKTNQEIIDALKKAYYPCIEHIIESEEKYIKDFSDIKSRQMKYKYLVNGKLKYKKRVFLRSSEDFHTKNGISSLLKMKKFHSAHKELKDETFEDENIACLHLTLNECESIIKDEMQDFGYEKTNVNDDKAYAIIALPYVYNEDNGEVKASFDAENLSVSFMPKVQIEYGVFFDGTLNNMYNIEFYRKIRNFVHFRCEKVSELVEEGVLPKENYEYTKIHEYIAYETKPEKTNRLMNIFRSELLDNVRYFEKKSLDRDSDAYDKWIQDRASSDIENIFDYLMNVKNGYIKIDPVGKDNPKPKYRKLIKEFIVDQIIPGGDMHGSYTNGTTNIKRLYDCYLGLDRINEHKSKCRLNSFKVYTTGSGTKDPEHEGKLRKDDSGISPSSGLSFGLGINGVVGNILKTCEKIADQLREEQIFEIDELVLDVFGFSRGSASARHFMCSMMNNYEVKKDAIRDYTLDTKGKKNIFSCFYTQNGTHRFMEGNVYFNPLESELKSINIGDRVHFNPYYKDKAEAILINSVSFRFAGIYDTVTHYGLWQSDDYKELNLDFFINKKSYKFGQLVHLMAKDEFRYDFEAHSIYDAKHDGVKTEGGGRVFEAVIPGAHADVGGAYTDADDKMLLYSTIKNEDISESLKKQIEIWNEKYFWMKETKVIIIQRSDDVDDDESYPEHAFYIIKHKSTQDQAGVKKTRYKFKVYLNKKDMDFKYEYVTLQLMLNKVVFKTDNLEEIKEFDERPPFDKEENFDFSKNELLKKVYEDLKSDYVLNDIDLYKDLKNKYLHYSSYFSKIGYSPSAKNKAKDDFYGERVVYGVSGKEL